MRPSTDKMTVVEWIQALGNPSTKVSEGGQALLREASLAAVDLMEYRHAVVHGWLVPSPLGPSFIRNPRWKGEIRIKRKASNEAHVDKNLLDMAIDTAWVLCAVVFSVRAACENSSELGALLDLRQDVARARSQASELRHLTALMEHEKY